MKNKPSHQNEPNIKVYIIAKRYNVQVYADNAKVEYDPEVPQHPLPIYIYKTIKDTLVRNDLQLAF